MLARGDQAPARARPARRLPFPGVSRVPRQLPCSWPRSRCSPSSPDRADGSAAPEEHHSSERYSFPELYCSRYSERCSLPSKPSIEAGMTDLMPADADSPWLDLPAGTAAARHPREGRYCDCAWSLGRRHYGEHAIHIGPGTAGQQRRGSRRLQTTRSPQRPARRPVHPAAGRSSGPSAAGNAVISTPIARVSGITYETGRGCQRRTRRGCGSASPAERPAPGRIW
jgi:hypothetical protein